MGSKIQRNKVFFCWQFRYIHIPNCCESIHDHKYNRSLASLALVVYLLIRYTVMNQAVACTFITMAAQVSHLSWKRGKVECISILLFSVKNHPTYCFPEVLFPPRWDVKNVCSCFTAARLYIVAQARKSHECMLIYMQTWKRTTCTTIRCPELHAGR